MNALAINALALFVNAPCLSAQQKIFKNICHFYLFYLNCAVYIRDINLIGSLIHILKLPNKPKP